MKNHTTYSTWCGIRAGLLLIGAGLLASQQAQAQGVGIGTATPNPSAALDVRAADPVNNPQGFLPPRLTYVQRTSISNAAAGLLVYQSDSPSGQPAAGYYYYTGTQWLPLQSSGDNLGNHQATQPLSFATADGDKLLLTAAGVNGSKINHGAGWSFNYFAGPGQGSSTQGLHRFLTTTALGGYVERLRITPNGNVGIGTSGPGQRLEVNGSAYVNAENSGFVVDNGSQRRVGLMKYAGRNSGLWRTGSTDFEIGRVNVSDLTVATGSNTFVTDLYVGGNGRVGVGTTAPQEALDVNGRVTASNVTLRNFASNQATLLAIRGGNGEVGQPLSVDLPLTSTVQTLGWAGWDWHHNLGYKPVFMLSLENLSDTTQPTVALYYVNLDDNTTRIRLNNRGLPVSNVVVHAVVIR